MNLSTGQNSASIQLDPSEKFYLKPSLLKGFGSFDWAFPPPHPLGSPFLRLYHRAWILKEVCSGKESLNFQIYGDHSRGNFKSIRLIPGERLCIAIHALAGFSGDLHAIHTRIRFSPVYWLFHEHFFAVFEGPGTLLLYSASSIEETSQTEFQPRRLVVFDAQKKFRPISPQPKRLISQIINLLFSHEVIWQFQTPGKVWAETCSESELKRKGGFFGRFLKHLLGLLRI